jgi:hypothetical protein
MSYMQKIMSGIKVDHLLAELNEHPELWNRYDFRTNYQGSAHADVSDIVLRYRTFDEFDYENPTDFCNEHESVWYAAAHIIPSSKEVIENVASACGINQIGGCLITRIPAGKSVKPHTDKGYWHSEYYKDKILLLLKSSEGQSFNFEGDERHEGVAGDAFLFDNRVTHWVDNNSDIDRISLIIAGRMD